MASEVPVLDCSKISGPYKTLQGSTSYLEFMNELGNAMSGVGFVYLVNHGLDSNIVRGVKLLKSSRFYY